jgi:hypothetical protein
LLNNVGVLGVEESIGSFTLPVDAGDQPCIESRCDPIQRVDSEPAGAGSLNPCDQRLGNARPPRKVDLTPDPSHSERSDHPANSDRIHSP